MKMLFINTHYHPYKGGLETYTLELAKRLTKNNKVTVMCLNTENSPGHEIHERIEIQRIPCYNILPGTYAIPKPKETKKLMKLKMEYDVIITNTRFFWTSYIGQKLAKKNKIKHVHIEHGMSHVKHPNKIIQTIAWIYDMTFGKHIIRNADLNIGISRRHKEFLHKMGSKKSRIINNSINTKEWE